MRFWLPEAVLGGGDQVAQRGDTPDMMGPPAGQRDRLVEVGSWPQHIADLVKGSAEAMGGPKLLEATHGTIAPFYAPVILFQHIIFVLISPMFYSFPEFFGDGCGVAGVAVGRHLLRLDLSDRLGGAEERLGRSEIAGFAQIDIDQVPVAVDCSVEITPLTRNSNVRFISMPTLANLATPPLAQTLGQQRRQLGFPVAHRLVGEDHAADQKHFGQVAQAQFVAQAPKHHEKHDVGWELNMVEHRTRALVVPPPARPALETPAALHRPAYTLGR